MAENNKTKENRTYKHLTKEERVEIQECLSHGMDFKHIARRINKDQTTVSREIKKHIEVLPARSAAEANKVCEALLKAPFVCNGCARRSHCLKERRMYYAIKADRNPHGVMRNGKIMDIRTKLILFCLPIVV